MRSIITHLREGRLDLISYNKLTGIQLKADTKHTTVNHATMNNSSISLTVYIASIDQNSKILKAVIFKDYIDDEKYKFTDLTFWVLNNATNDCSRFIDSPVSNLVAVSCATANLTLPDQKVVRKEAEYQAKPPEPTIIMDGFNVVIQCYNYQIATSSWKEVCDKRPYILPNNMSFLVNGFESNYHHEELSLAESIAFNHSSVSNGQPTDQWLLSARQNIGFMREKHEENDRLSLDSARALISENIEITTIVIVLLALTLAWQVFLKLDPFLILAKFTAVSSITKQPGFEVDRRSGRSMTSINIQIGNQLGRLSRNKSFDSLATRRLADSPYKRPLTPFIHFADKVTQPGCSRKRENSYARRVERTLNGLFRASRHPTSSGFFRLKIV